MSDRALRKHKQDHCLDGGFCKEDHAHSFVVKKYSARDQSCCKIIISPNDRDQFFFLILVDILEEA